MTEPSAARAAASPCVVARDRFGLFMLAFYVPAGYFIDTFMWRRRERARIRARQE